MMPNFASLFTPSGVLAFIAGMATMRAWYFFRCKWLDRKDPEGAPHHTRAKTMVLGWGIVIVGILYMGVQTQVTHDETVGQAQMAKQIATKVAWYEYFEDKGHCEFTHWLAVGMNPPQNIFNLQTINPQYQEWARGVNQEYFRKLAQLQKEREEHANDPNPPPSLAVKCHV